jgi:hypothetical protein
MDGVAAHAPPAVRNPASAAAQNNPLFMYANRSAVKQALKSSKFEYVFINSGEAASGP